MFFPSNVSRNIDKINKSNVNRNKLFAIERGEKTRKLNKLN